MIQLKQLRGNMSQSELARESGVSQKTISAIELGRIAKPTYETALKLSKVLNCKPELLLGIVEEKPLSKMAALKKKLKK